MWRLLKRVLAALLVINLNPHCVSRMPLTVKTHTRAWNPYMSTVRKKDLLATDSSSRWAREPHTTATLSDGSASEGKRA